MPVYGSTGTIAVYPLYSKAPVISKKAVVVSDFIIASYKTLALVKPLLDVLYYYTM